ncbi:MAG: DNA-processing protein DprA [Oscillospiraceae bacterium]|nr:DNA-processing protein DprA [Oscillospiraceae bacterium]
MLQYWIWLAERQKLGAAAKIALLEHFGSPEAVFLADAYELSRVECIKESMLESLLDKNLSAAEKILRTCDDKRITVMTYGDASYPERLRYIDSPPIVLYCDGNLPAIDRAPAIAMVGKRSASAYGLQQARRLGYQLSRSGFIVVSGAASGIDTQSLIGALTGDKPVIAVLGNGTDVVYPKENKRLYEDIRARGCLISEYPPGTRPLGEHFPVRNRLISGLSLGVIVVEADLRSGAMITARRALEQGRDVFAVPGNVGVDTMRGNLQLLKDGAMLVEDCMDVVSVYAGQYPWLADEYKPGSFEGGQPLKTAEESAAPQKSIDKPKTTNYINIDEILPTLKPDEAAIVRFLSGGVVLTDELIDGLQMPAAKVLSTVTMLEIRKIVQRLTGNRISLAQQEQNG